MKKGKVIILLCAMLCSMVACGNGQEKILGTTTELQKSRVYRHGFAPDGIQWDTGLGWRYHICLEHEQEDTDCIGYFAFEQHMPKKSEKRTNYAQFLKQKWESGIIHVYCADMSEEEFFAQIQLKIEEMETEEVKNGKKEAVCLIDGHASISQIVRIDTEYNHWLYLREGERVYILHSEMHSANWQNFLNCWIEGAQASFAGKPLLTEGYSAVADALEEWKAYGAVRKVFTYCGLEIIYQGEVNAFHSIENGIVMERNYEGELISEKMVLQMVDSLPDDNTAEDMIMFFMEKYPEMTLCEKYLNQENAEQEFWIIEEAESIHGFFEGQDGTFYEVISSGRNLKETNSYMVAEMRRQLSYEWDAAICWEYHETDDTVFYENDANGYWYREVEIEEGEKITIAIEVLEEVPGELVMNRYIQISVFEEEETEPFQVIEECTTMYDCPLVLEDFNADGYLDMTIEYFYGANGGTAMHYVWSPSQKQFVRVSNELDYYGSYRIDYETKRLYMHYHGTAVSGTENMYRWKGETEYELVKSFTHDTVDDNEKVYVKIYRYEDGEKQILSDYKYSMEEYEERISEIWNIYYLDFVWETEMTDTDTGEKYIVRYAQMKEESGWFDMVYIFSSDTYLLQSISEVAPAEYECVCWEDKDADGVEEMYVSYQEGTQKGYDLWGILKP